MINGHLKLLCLGQRNSFLFLEKLKIYSIEASTNTRAMFGWPVGQAVYQIVAFPSA